MEQITQALVALGNTPEEVYQNLKDQGIKGLQRHTCMCPVANYLTKTIGEKCSTGLTTAGPYGNAERTVDVPAPVQRFIRMFDDGLFEDLLDGSHQ